MQRGQREDNAFFGDEEMELDQQNDNSQLLDISQFKSCLDSPEPRVDPYRMNTRQFNKSNQNKKNSSRSGSQKKTPNKRKH